MSISEKCVILEGSYARALIAEEQKALPEKRDLFRHSSPAAQIQSRYLARTKSPHFLYEKLLLWNRVVTFGPASMKRFGRTEVEAHLNPFDGGDINRRYQNYLQLESLTSYVTDEDRIQGELITYELILEVLRSSYFETNPIALPRSYSKEIGRISEWRYLNLNRQFLMKAIQICATAGKVVFSRNPEGLEPREIESGENYGFYYARRPSWLAIQATIAAELDKLASNNQLQYNGRDIDALQASHQSEGWADALMIDIANAYYYSDGLVLPWRAGTDLLSSSLASARARRPESTSFAPDALVAAEIYLDGIEFWPTPRNLAEYEDCRDNHDIVVLRENFHAWKDAALETSDRRQLKIEKNMRLAAKSIRSIRTYRTLNRLNVYVSGLFGAIPFSSPFFSGATLLLEKLEDKEKAKLGAMGVKIV